MLSDSLGISRLRAFQIVARNGSLRVAAKRLGRTIPAISIRIRQLEKTIGVDLFERLPNKMVLTAAGVAFLEHVDFMFETTENALRNISSPKALRLSVSVGSDHSRFFAPQICRYLKRHPNIQLTLQIYKAQEAISALQRGDLDAAIGIFRSAPRGLQKEILCTTELALLCPTRHRLNRKKPVLIREVANQRLILPERDSETRKIIDSAFAKNAIEPYDVIEVTNCATAQVFAEQGVGLAIVHSLCVAHNSSSKLAHVRFERSVGNIEFSWVSRKGRLAKAPQLRELFDTLKNEPSDRRL